MQPKPIHPFPARMAPELALNTLSHLKRGSVVLDPMAGSGTVLRQALDLGHTAIGYDIDPLAVLMARVWTTPISSSVFFDELDRTLEKASSVDLRRDKLPWLDRETTDFIHYWFAPKQRQDLSRIAYALHDRTCDRLSSQRRAAVRALMVALSRIIVTKDQGASLARDTSHSRPHKVSEDSDYDVFAGFARSAKSLSTRLDDSFACEAKISFGDARRIALDDCAVDSVLTSPPYLNAIDYMRGHRLALVWLGYRLSELRAIRSESIGAERACISSDTSRDRIAKSMVGDAELADRMRLMIRRYAGDIILMMSEISRVLKFGGQATIVVGNSCLRGTFVQNAKGVCQAGRLAGLVLKSAVDRELPSNNRYLPVTDTGTLSKRMRTETVLTFLKR